jgi:uncharacterized Zn-binding protein involved in type VI secretion
MSFKKVAIATITAMSLVVVPTIAQAAQAQATTASKLSVRAAPAVRNGARVGEENNLGGSIVIALAAAAAVIAGIIIATRGRSTPRSP